MQLALPPPAPSTPLPIGHFSQRHKQNHHLEVSSLKLHVLPQEVLMRPLPAGALRAFGREEGVRGGGTRGGAGVRHLNKVPGDSVTSPLAPRRTASLKLGIMC